MKLSLIASIAEGELRGTDCEITGISDLEHQEEGTIAFAENKKSMDILKNSQVSALIIKKDSELPEKPVILVNDPKFAFTKIIELFSPYKPYPVKQYENVYVESTAKIGKDVTIMPFTSIMDNASIGDGTVIYSQVFIGKNVKVGTNCIIKAGVKIDDETVVGNNVIIHHNSVIGGDGFNYVEKHGVHVKFHHIGNIEIEDDVEIGACVTVDRAAIVKTTIGKGTKIDNLVQIAHNVKIGSNTILCSQVGVAGSSKIGNNCVLAGQVGVANHLTIGNNVVVLARSGIATNLDDRKMYWGTPATEATQQKRINICLHRLPDIVKKIELLSKTYESSLKS